MISIKKNLDDNFVQGTCLDMCPISERKLREKENLIHILETSNEDIYKDPKSGKIRYKENLNLMIKSFHRSAAGVELNLAENLRPPNILIKTVNYLLTSVIKNNKLPWCEIYNFISDRLRCVKQDAQIQQIDNKSYTEILEKIIRFYAYASYRQCNLPKHKSILCIDKYLNTKQLEESLHLCIKFYDQIFSHDDKLYNSERQEYIGHDQSYSFKDQFYKIDSNYDQFYGNYNQLHNYDEQNDSYEDQQHRNEGQLHRNDDQLHRNDTQFKNQIKNRIEIECIYLIISIKDYQILYRALKLRNYKSIQSTLHLCLRYIDNDYIQVFKTLSKIPSLATIVFAGLYLANFRRKCLELLNTSFNCKNNYLPLNYIKQNLLFKSNDEVIELCIKCGLNVNRDEEKVLCQKNMFKQNENIEELYKLDLIDSILLEENLKQLSLNTI